MKSCLSFKNPNLTQYSMDIQSISIILDENANQLYLHGYNM